MTTLKIASWNINSVRARATIVERLLDEEQPDILCLQETKAQDHVFPGRPVSLARLRPSRAQWPEDASWRRDPRRDCRLRDAGRHDWQDNGEARHVGVRLECGIRLENVYIPAGGDVPDRDLNPKFGQKLDFIERMTRWSEKLAEPTLIVGDFNIAPLECDVWSHKALLDVVSHTPIEVETLEPPAGRRMTGSTSAAASFRRRSAISPGGATAPRTGRRATAAAGSTICGLRPSLRRRRRRIACSSPAADGSGRRIMFR